MNGTAENLREKCRDLLELKKLTIPMLGAERVCFGPTEGSPMLEAEYDDPKKVNGYLYVLCCADGGRLPLRAFRPSFWKPPAEDL
jgi:hypothetical protein